jgi:peptidoglycan/xylan/chitin deacetylase (PgdA/CDA1 family)
LKGEQKHPVQETCERMEKTKIVTTSWDDGDHADLRLAELLRSRKIQATFYVPIVPYRGRWALNRSEWKALSSEGFEIGAHGYSHRLLKGLTSEELAKEVDPCKPALEDVLGKEVGMFCYPCGRYDSNVVRVLKNAGYRGARTVRMLATQLDFDAFEMPTTLQMFPHRPMSYIRNITRARKVEGLRAYLANRTKLGMWLELGKALFDRVLQDGGIWHMYGHSWEIDELGLWEDLEQILDYVCNRKGVMYVPNSELVPFSSANCRSVDGDCKP